MFLVFLRPNFAIPNLGVSPKQVQEPGMTLNRVTAVIVCYLSQGNSFRSQLR